MANNRNKYPRVRAKITFRIKEEGGRKTPIKDNYHYCPHIVIGDPGQKKAIIESGNKLSENYLGIQFSGNGQVLHPGKEYEVEFSLLYWPNVDYSAITKDATFTVREGPHIVAHGKIISDIKI